MRPANSFGDTLLARMDRWKERSDWLPEQDQRIPGGVFWGIFGWNFPILLLSIGVIGLLFYQSDPDSSGIGFFSTLNWKVELAIGSVGLAFLIDLGGCLWLRRLWNRRARWLREERDAPPPAAHAS